MKNKTIVLLSFLIYSCWGWDGADLGNGYQYLNRTIFKINKHEHMYDSWIVIVPKEVLNYSYDDKYIIVHQIPAYDEARQSIRETSSQEEKDSLDEQNRKMQSIGDCYWIIIKGSSEINGPLTRAEFEAMCIELKVTTVFLREREKRKTISGDGSLQSKAAEPSAP